MSKIQRQYRKTERNIKGLNSFTRSVFDRNPVMRQINIDGENDADRALTNDVGFKKRHSQDVNNSARQKKDSESNLLLLVKKWQKLIKDPK